MDVKYVLTIKISKKEIINALFTEDRYLYSERLWISKGILNRTESDRIYGYNELFFQDILEYIKGQGIQNISSLNKLKQLVKLGLVLEEYQDGKYQNKLDINI